MRAGNAALCRFCFFYLFFFVLGFLWFHFFFFFYFFRTPFHVEIKPYKWETFLGLFIIGDKLGSNNLGSKIARFFLVSQTKTISLLKEILRCIQYMDFIAEFLYCFFFHRQNIFWYYHRQLALQYYHNRLSHISSLYVNVLAFVLHMCTFLHWCFNTE